MASSLFPSVGTQVLSAVIHLLGVSILAHYFSRRFMLDRISSFSDLRNMPWPRICLLLVFLDSWCFLFTAGILIFGVGLETHESVCRAGIFICVIFYATSKLLIYAFLIERVYIVWSPANLVGRFKSRVYIVSLITVCLYGVVIIMMIIGRINFLREGDGACMIGLKMYSSIPLLSYDLYITVFLTTLFLWPLLRRSGTMMDDKVKRMGRRALVASGIALLTSTVNITVLTIMHGHQLGWLCLGSCGADVIVNASSLYWASGRKSAESFDERPATTPSTNRISKSQHTRAHHTLEPRSPVSMHSPVASPNTATNIFWWTKKEDANSRKEEQAVRITITTEETTSVAMQDYPKKHIDGDSMV